MSYLIETDRAVDWWNRQSEARDLLNMLMPEGLRMSLISYGEVYEGVYYGRDRPLRFEVFSDFLRIVRVIPLDRLHSSVSLVNVDNCVIKAHRLRTRTCS